MTTFDRFKSLAARGGLVPVWRDCLLDGETPVSAFAKLRRGPFAFLLESAPAGGETWARYTFMGTEPRGAWRLTDGVAEDWTPEKGWHGARTPADPLADLQRLVALHEPVDVPELGAFWSGVVGFFSYDIARHIERLPNAPPRAIAAPDALFVFTHALVIIDALRSQARVVVGVPVAAGASDAELHRAHGDALRDIDATIARLRAPGSLAPLDLDRSAPPATGTFKYSRAKFEADVERIREYIFAGDCFQALLARRIEVPLDFEPAALYRALRALNPSPYMYHLVLDGLELVGSSPELLVRVAGGRVTVRPIAGTRPRGLTPEDDERLAAELLVDEKERAEHVMLVDLGRNDVGRIAKYGTVEVTDLMVVERYSHVFHIVSQVEGAAAGRRLGHRRLPRDVSRGHDDRRAEGSRDADHRRAGARAPRPVRGRDRIHRGGRPAHGSRDHHPHLRDSGRRRVDPGGAGIVADSIPANEWEETENKARSMLTAIGQVRKRS